MQLKKSFVVYGQVSQRRYCQDFRGQLQLLSENPWADL